jgi:thermolabile hemolysin
MDSKAEPRPAAILVCQKRRRIWMKRKAVAAVILVGLISRAAAAGPFSQLVVFGDSLSDVGNVSQATAAIPFVPTTPGPHYYNGRFSNGPVYAELLAEGLGLPPLEHNRSGGSNFAHGGAMTSGTGFPENFVVRDVDDQVGDLLGSPDFDSEALYVVFAGANDLLGGQTNMNVPVNRLAADIGRLISAGANQFLVFNLPLLGFTPRFNGNSTTFAEYNVRSRLFNSTLDTMLDGIEMSNPTISMYQFDVAALFSEAISSPAAFGLANVTQPAAPGLQPGASSYDTNRIADNPSAYMFWDDVHPTAAVHAILAQRALQLFIPPGDFNRDGIVDAADYVVWRSANGTTADYETWRTHFGQTGGSGAVSQFHSGASASVPEPAAWRLVLLIIIGFAARRTPATR